MAEYITKEILKDMIGEKNYSVLSNMSIDAGANFLSGKVQSAVNGIVTDPLSQAAIDIGTNIYGDITLVSGIKDNAEMLKRIGSQIAAGTIERVTEGITQEITSLSAYALDIPLEDIASKAAAYFSHYKKSEKEILREVLTFDESQMTDFDDSLKKDSQESFISKASSFVGKVKNDMTQTLSYASSYINMINAYIAEGPDYIVKMLNMNVSNIMSSVDEKLANSREWIGKEKQEFIDTQGVKLGKSMTEKYNNEVAKALKRHQDDISNAKAQSEIKLSKTKQAARLAVYAVIGI